MAKKEAKKENNKNKKSFFKDFKAELKKVNWPTPKQLVNNTTAVITIVIITAAIVFVLDLVFEALNKQGIEKIKESIVTENNTDNNISNDTTANEIDSTNTTNSTDENSDIIEDDNTVVESTQTTNTENSEQ